MATVEKRPLTAAEMRAAQRLKAAWEMYQSKNKGATQEWLASNTGLGNQTLMSQYLNGQIQLNLKALLKLCGVIGADPKEIFPEIAGNVPSANQEQINSDTAAEIAELIFLYIRAPSEAREATLGALRDNVSGLTAGRKSL